jgi:hypothetical protein
MNKVVSWQEKVKGQCWQLIYGDSALLMTLNKCRDEPNTWLIYCLEERFKCKDILTLSEAKRQSLVRFREIVEKLILNLP